MVAVAKLKPKEVKVC